MPQYNNSFYLKHAYKISYEIITKTWYCWWSISHV